MRDWARALLMILGLIIFGLFAFFFAGTLILAVLLFLVVAWACGMPITIKSSGEEIGYVRWFTFHKK